jgi:peptidoglycan/LPS O-acetylase OafA/YrhL
MNGNHSTFSERNYRPEVDGLRSVAVLPVIAYHAGFAAIPGGFAGVDVFFVISGFLITGIIAEELEAGRFSLGRFYERRARRILPALFAMMLPTLAIAWLVMVPYQLEDLAQSVVATLLFVSNILFWLEADYFAVEASSKPLLHTWSLAVEEQFYVVMPLLLAMLYRIDRRVVIPVLVVGAIASFGLALTYGQTAPSATFFLIQFRAWELLVGSLAALWMRLASPAPNPWYAGIGLVAVATSFFVVTENALWPGPLTLLSVLGTAALLLFVRSDVGVGRLLAWEPIRFVGLISYSLYLWHLPPLVFLHIAYFDDIPLWATLSAVAFAFVMAWVSWRFVERPFRQPGRIALRTFVPIVLLAALPMAVFGVVGVRTTGFQALLLAQISAEHKHRVIDRDKEVAARAPLWDRLEDASTRPFSEGDGRHKVLILGDSMSGDLIVATAGHPDRFPKTEFRRMRLDDRCMGRMVMAIDQSLREAGSKERCAREVTQLLSSNLIETADEIVLAANWQPETVDDGIALAQRLVDRGTPVAIQGVAAFNDVASLSMRLHRLSEPSAKFFYKNIRSKFKPVNARIAATAASVPGIRYLDKLKLLCDDAAETCDVQVANGKPIIFDSAHVTLEGVDVLSDRIARSGWFE